MTEQSTDLVEEGTEMPSGDQSEDVADTNNVPLEPSTPVSTGSEDGCESAGEPDLGITVAELANGLREEAETGIEDLSSLTTTPAVPTESVSVVTALSKSQIDVTAYDRPIR